MDQKRQILQNRISPGIMYFGLLPGKHASYNVSGKKREIKSYQIADEELYNLK